MTSTSIAELLTQEHQDCDAAFAEFEATADARSADLAPAAFQQFCALTEQHFGKEEGVLFPAFEAATGMTQGPTSVMRAEHVQMRDLMAQISTALTQGDFDEALGLSQTLLMVMQQHNQKEEHMLYPMSDRALAVDLGTFLERLQ